MSSVKDRLYPLPPSLAWLEGLIEHLPRQRLEVVCSAHENIVVMDAESFMATGSPARFSVQIVPAIAAGGWFYLEAALTRHSGNREARIIAEMANGRIFETLIPANLRGTIREVLFLPPGVRLLYWAPMAEKGYFSQSELQLHRISSIESWLRRAQRVLSWGHVFRNAETLPEELTTPFQRLHHLQKAYEFTALSQVKRYAASSYVDFLARKKKVLHPPHQQLLNKMAKFTRKPKFSLLMLVTDEVTDGLLATLNSIIDQLYPEWELLVVGQSAAMSKWTLPQATGGQRILFHSVSREESLIDVGNKLLEQVHGQWVARIPAGARLTPEALYFIAEALQVGGPVKLVYTDHDVIGEHDQLKDPCFKPDWNPDMLLATDYIRQLALMDVPLVKELGGWRNEYAGAEEYDLLLRATHRLKIGQILHIQHALIHLPEHSASIAPVQHEAGKRALHDLFVDKVVSITDGLGDGLYHVRHSLPDIPPLVSILIPTRDRLDILKTCVESIRTCTTYINWEIIIIDNQSVEVETLGWFRQVQEDNRISVLKWDYPFNYSAINNFAANQARGEVLALLNNDVEIITPDWLDEMVGHAIRPEIGAVGAKLLYSNGTVQHAGVITGLGGVAGHAHKYQKGDESGYCHRAVATQNLSAVTGACLVVKKSRYLEVEGLNETDLVVAMNDVDFCLKLREAGYRNVFTPYAQLFHHESLSRGRDDTPEKQAIFRRESEYMKCKWGDALSQDPAYNLNLTLEFEDFSLRYA